MGADPWIGATRPRTPPPTARCVDNGAMTSSHSPRRRRRWWHFGRRRSDLATLQGQVPIDAALSVRGLLVEGGAAPDAGAAPDGGATPDGGTVGAQGGTEGTTEGAGLDLDVLRGSFTALVTDPATTIPLMTTLAGLRAPAAGAVLVEGHGPGGLGEGGATPLTGRARIGVVLGGTDWAGQAVAPLDLHQNVLLAASTAGWAVTPEHLDRVMEVAGLRGTRTGPAVTSGVRAAALALARALVTDPAVVLASLSDNDADVLPVLRSAVDALGRTVVLVTSDADQALWADRVIVLAGATVVADMRAPSREAIVAAQGVPAGAGRPAPGGPAPVAGAEGDGSALGGSAAGGSALDGSALGVAAPGSDRTGEAVEQDAGTVAAGVALVDGTGAGVALVDEVGDGDVGPEPQVATDPRTYTGPSRRSLRSGDEGPRTQEIAVLAAERVRAIEEATARSAAAPDTLREELGAEMFSAAPRPAPTPVDLPEDSAEVLDKARRILGDLPGSVMPDK